MISDEIEIKNNNKKIKSSTTLTFLNLINLDNKIDFIKARAEADSALKKKIF